MGAILCRGEIAVVKLRRGRFRGFARLLCGDTLLQRERPEKVGALLRVIAWLVRGIRCRLDGGSSSGTIDLS